MVYNENRAYILASIGLLLLGGAYLLASHYSSPFDDMQTSREDTEVHVHADVLFVVDGYKIDLSQDVYQSSAENILHPYMHLHDNEGDILHRHEEGVVLKDFLDSIGFTLEDDCLTLDSGEQRCADKDNALQLFVNNSSVSNIADYVIQDEDRILLYYGVDAQAEIDTHLDSISDRACIYSGTCPERGTPPPESCGLTCDI